jgi:hypothetical protein
MPKRGNIDFSILYDPPYKLFEDTMWSPDFKKVRIPVDKAAVPEQVATAAIPPSSAAIRCSSTSVVGLFRRVYIYPGSANAKRFAACSALLKTKEVD